MTNQQKAFNRICRDCGSLILEPLRVGRPSVRCDDCKTDFAAFGKKPCFGGKVWSNVKIRKYERG